MARATVIRPITIILIDDLDFGIVRSESSGGFVEVSHLTGVQYIGGARLGCRQLGICPAPHAARFSVSGEANRSYTVTLPKTLAIRPAAERTLAQEQDGRFSDSLIVDAITVLSVSGQIGNATGKLDVNGKDQFEIFGRLRMPSETKPGRYRAQIPILVVYS